MCAGAFGMPRGLEPLESRSRSQLAELAGIAEMRAEIAELAELAEDAGRRPEGCAEGRLAADPSISSISSISGAKYGARYGTISEATSGVLSSISGARYGGGRERRR